MPKDELRRLESGALPGEPVEGVGIDPLKVRCMHDASSVLSRVKECLAPAITSGPATDPSALPSWFLESFADDSTALERYRGDPFNEGSSRWTLDGWLFWFDPDERMWRWWDGEIVSDSEISIRIVALDWPTPTGALKWLLYAAGAVSVKYS